MKRLDLGTFLKSLSSKQPSPDKSSTRIQWNEHRSHGGTGVQRIDPESLPFYEKVVKEFNSPDVWLVGDALHASRTDITDFWKFVKAHPDYEAWWAGVKSRVGIHFLPHEQ